jgi:hypothetical protein
MSPMSQAPRVLLRGIRLAREKTMLDMGSNMAELPTSFAFELSSMETVMICEPSFHDSVELFLR